MTIGSGATLTLDNSAVEHSDRIGNGTTITLGGGTLNFISDNNGSAETVGALNASGGASTISVVHNGLLADTTSLTFSSVGRSPLVPRSVSPPPAARSAPPRPDRTFITGQAIGLIGGWATVGSNFADIPHRPAYGVFGSYYTGSDGVNVNDPGKIRAAAAPRLHPHTP